MLQHLNETDEALIDRLQRSAFEYFMLYTNPDNGLVADRTRLSTRRVRARSVDLFRIASYSPWSEEMLPRCFPRAFASACCNNGLCWIS